MQRKFLRLGELYFVKKRHEVILIQIVNSNDYIEEYLREYN